MSNNVTRDPKLVTRDSLDWVRRTRIVAGVGAMKTPIRSSKALTKAIEAALEAAYRAGFRDATSANRMGPRKGFQGSKAHLSSAELKRSVTARELVLTALEANARTATSRNLRVVKIEGTEHQFRSSTPSDYPAG